MAKLLSIMNKKSDSKKIILNWIINTTFHGLPKVIKTRNIKIKIIWIIILLISTFICFYLLIINIMNYLDFGVITKIQKITEIPALLPTITICNLNPFVTKYSNQFLENIFNKYNNLTNLSKITYNPNRISQNLKLLKYLANINVNILTNSEKQKFGYKLEDMLISCMINGNECKPDDFVWHYDSFHGNCFSLNSGYDSKMKKMNLIKIFNSGKLSGISLELFVGPIEDEYYNELISSIGAYIFIHNNSIKPISSEGFAIPTGINTNIALDRIFSNRISQPYSNCINLNEPHDSYLYNYLLKKLNNSYLYRQKECFNLCYQSNTIQKCKCYDTRLNKYESNETRPCLNHFEIKCVFKIYNDFLNGKLNDQCLILCPLECNTYSFTEFSSFTQYPTDNYVKMLKKHHSILQKYDVNTIKKNILAFNVYYQSLEYTVIDEIERSLFFDLISGIGGTFGLFLGTSFLSFIELFEVLFKIISINFKNKFQKNKEPPGRIELPTPGLQDQCSNH
jgi:hypothetical protein